jgi:hypothetical protein
MTCIAAIVKDGVVHMGGDSGGVDTEGGAIALFNDKKVFVRKGYLIGYSGSYIYGIYQIFQMDCHHLIQLKNL